ncbi:MAG: riboflavin synthase [Gemmatimonadales bacterium]|jgi:riboflavin synthase|nr:riboflavin synthase [Gemmatimonadales bacterium]
MFTGIVTGIGTVRQAVTRAGGLEITIESPYRDLEPGESVAVDGACLTVESALPGAFSVHVVRTTLDRTRFGEYATGRRVNLERALKVGDRLSGHLVQAHVDGVGRVELVTQRDDARLLDLRVPDDVAQLTVRLGSITVDGVSLTVNAKPGWDVIQISLIPFTLQHTTLGERLVGDRVHLEADTIGKYVTALMEEQRKR